MNDRHPPLLPLILADVPAGLSTALAQEGMPFRPLVAGPPQGRFLLLDSRRAGCPLPASGQVAIDVSQLGNGSGGTLLESLADQRSQHCQWHVAGLKLVEEVARVDKQAVRRQVIAELRARIEEAGGVWLSVSPYPFPYRSAFNLRIDYDQYEPSDFAAMLDALHGHEHATSHFVNAAAYEGAGEALARLRGLDVGSHGYRHHTYRTEEENRRNIRRGIDLLESAGLEPRGFVAPHGRFNRTLLAALQALDVPYSSEFGLAYDELPFFPAESEVLQVPVHPVCLGLFLDAVRRRYADGTSPPGEQLEAAVGQAADYFDAVARARYQAGRPVFLYGHPTGRLGRYPQLLARVLGTVSQWGGIWQTTMSEFSAWWRARGQVRLTVEKDESGYVVTVHRKPAGWRVGLDVWRGEHVALLPLDRSRMNFSPQGLAFQKRKAGDGPQPVRVDPPEGLRGRVRRLLDWERVTPLEEIDTGAWHNWVKRTLRQIWRD